MSNEFSFYSNDDKATASFLRSVVQSSDKILEHYHFVLNDISSNISDPELEASKGPAVEFLTAMISKWEAFRDDAVQKLNKYLSDSSKS